MAYLKNLGNHGDRFTFLPLPPSIPINTANLTLWTKSHSLAVSQLLIHQAA